MVTTRAPLMEVMSLLVQSHDSVFDVDPSRGVRILLGPQSPLCDGDHARALLDAARHQQLGRLFIGVQRLEGIDARLIYIVALTPGGPAGDQTVTIGGDRYMAGADLDRAIERAASLSYGMAAKSSTAAPFALQALRGKKSVFFCLDDQGRPFSPPDEAVKLGYVRMVATALPVVNHSLLGRMPNVGEMYPVTASPDVWTGPHWEKLATLFHSAAVDPRLYTCPPESLGGFGFASARPTAAAVDEAIGLYCQHLGLEVATQRYLIDGGGSCTGFQLEYLLARKVPIENISVIEPSEARVQFLRGQYPGLRVLYGRTEEVGLELKQQVDVFIVNGLGDQVSERLIAHLDKCDVRLIVGCANALFHIPEEAAIAALCRRSGIVAVPSPTLNYGGWLCALVGACCTAAGETLPRYAGLVEPLARAMQRGIAAELIGIMRCGPLDYYSAGMDLINRRLERAQSAHVSPEHCSPRVLLEAFVSNASDLPGNADPIARISPPAKRPDAPSPVVKVSSDDGGVFLLDRKPRDKSA